ncbi:MAG: urease accessory protein UreF [Synechococcales bacterium]|nr:urease accessory protein UreF [Synechococcales bacterium]
MSLLHLLQLASPNLPVGAYSYSEGLETLVQQQIVRDRDRLAAWLTQELHYGAIRVEAAVMVRAYRSVQGQNGAQLRVWNDWLTAARETEELRSQSLQMGNSLLRLLQNLPSIDPATLNALIQTIQFPPIHVADRDRNKIPNGCHFAIAFALAAQLWQIGESEALLGYLHSWLNNLINAGIKLIPLGQTDGQRLLLEFAPRLEQIAPEIQHLPDRDLTSCSWGLAIASMQHETLYSRLFRS